MLKQKDIMDCLPLLASVLGNQYGVTVEIGGSEAYTDGKTIHLPALPLDSEPELITMIKGYTDHESAHIRETDFEILRKANLTPFQHNLFNILEDWRVEERLSARYPGCRENFRYLIQKLFGTQKAGDTNPAFSILNTILLTVRSWSVDAIIPRRESVAKTMERHYPGLRKALDGILDRVKDSWIPETASGMRWNWNKPPLPGVLNKNPSRNRRKRIQERLRMNLWLPQMPLWIL